MNRLSAILTPEDVAVDIEATGKPGLFDKVGLLLQTHYSIAMATVAANLLARERLGSTGLGHGVAIPHGRIKGLKSPVAAVVRLRKPIAFDAPDSEPVVLLVFLFVPEAATQRHLEILAEIAEMLADPGLRERLKNESDASALYRTIAAWRAPGAVDPSSS